MINPYVRLLVGWLVGRMVCHNVPKGREPTLPCSYRSTCVYSQLTHKRVPHKYIIEWNIGQYNNMEGEEGDIGHFHKCPFLFCVSVHIFGQNCACVRSRKIILLLHILLYYIWYLSIEKPKKIDTYFRVKKPTPS